MGTNYFSIENKCKECGRYDTIHLGKSSAGWQFSFQYNGGEYYKSVPEMKEWLKDKKIENEYGAEVSYDEFWQMVEEKQSNPSNFNHYEECKKKYGTREYELLIDGYSFTNCSFS